MIHLRLILVSIIAGGDCRGALGTGGLKEFIDKTIEVSALPTSDTIISII